MPRIKEPACRVCKCTEFNACADGCSWVKVPHNEMPLCSACSGTAADLASSIGQMDQMFWRHTGKAVLKLYRARVRLDAANLDATWGESLMSNLSRFMSTARAVLDEKEKLQNQPPFFVRTTWLFAELEELALHGEAETLFAALKVARLRHNVESVLPLLAKIEANTVAVLEPGPKRHQREQLARWIRDQIEKELKS